MLRFSRDRQRANHFYKKFLCQPFEPPASGLDIRTDGRNVEPDLQSRDGCRYCHSRLEPAASHWGRWRQNGAAYLDPRRYPAYSNDCRTCALTGRRCSDRCRQFYITDLREPHRRLYAGELKPYLFRRDRHRVNVEAGPEHLAAQAIGDNRLLECTARTRARALLGRPLADAEAPWLDRLVETFVESNYSYRALVEAIVTSDTYRRVR